jgi:hypothetical protein
MSDSALRFFTTPWTIGISIALVLAVVIVAFLTWKRSGFAIGTGLVELLRVLIACVVAMLLNQPEWVEEYRPDEKPTVVVLHDASRSMDTKDVVATDGSNAIGPRTRREVVAPLAESDFWKSLEERFQVVVEPVAPAPPGTATDLAEPLAQVAERFAALRAVVLASDGDWNKGRPPLDAAQMLRLAQVPVYAVPAGSPTKLPDLDLTSLDCPTMGVAGKPVRVPFTVVSSLPTERVVVATLATSTGEKLVKEVRIPPMANVTDWIYWTARFSPTTTHGRRRSPSARRTSRCWSSRRCRGGNTATSGTRSPAIPASRSRACSFSRGSPSGAAARRTTSRSFLPASMSFRNTTSCSSATSAWVRANSPRRTADS